MFYVRNKKILSLQNIQSEHLKQIFSLKNLPFSKKNTFNFYKFNQQFQGLLILLGLISKPGLFYINNISFFQSK
jgi:hypothetical protein